MTANNAPRDFVLGDDNAILGLNVLTSLPKPLIYRVIAMFHGQFGHVIFDNQAAAKRYICSLNRIKDLIARCNHLDQTAMPGFNYIEALKTTFIPAVLNFIQIYSKSMVPTDIRWGFCDVVRNIDELPNLPDDYWPEMVEFDSSRCGFVGFNRSSHTHLTWRHITGKDEIDLSPIELLVDEDDADEDDA